MRTILFLSIVVISIIFGLIILLFREKSNSQKVLSTLFFIMFIPVLSYVLIYLNNLTILIKIGIILGSIILILIIFNVLIYFIEKRIIFWSVPTGSILVNIFTLLVFSQHLFLDYIFYIGLGIGVALLFSGIYWKLFGLVIPGSLLIGISPGVFFAWSNTDGQNGLVRTGVMLVWFALGWGLVTIFARVQTLKFVWWPLIPGGILAMVGWGLYIGGNPSRAVGFIGNSGSIALLIFGIYILLIRRGIHH